MDCPTAGTRPEIEPSAVRARLDRCVLAMAEPPKNKIPPWAAEPLAQLSQSQLDVAWVHSLTIVGLRSIINRHEAFALYDAAIREMLKLNLDVIKEMDEAEDKTMLSMETAFAEQAHREVSNEFPILNSQTAVSVWSTIECFVEDVLVAWLANDPEFVNSERVGKIKIQYSDYHRMSESELNYLVISELQRDLPRGHEIERFESLLALAGLPGNLDAEVKRDLIELGHVRNVLLHRRGIADAKFVQACPWLNIKVGERVKINSDTAQRYLLAGGSYYQSMQARISAYFRPRRGLSPKAGAVADGSTDSGR